MIQIASPARTSRRIGGLALLAVLFVLVTGALVVLATVEWIAPASSAHIAG